MYASLCSEEGVKRLRETELRLDGEVREIVQRKKGALRALLLLPRLAAVSANAFQDGGSIRPLGYLNL